MNADQLHDVLVLARQGLSQRALTDGTQVLINLSMTLDAGEKQLANLRAHEAEKAKAIEAAKKTVEAEKAADQVIARAETRSIPKKSKTLKMPAPSDTTLLAAKEAPGP